MGLLYQIFIDPFVQMGTAPDLFVQTLWEGMKRPLPGNGERFTIRSSC